MNTKGVNFQPSERGQFSTAVDTLRIQQQELLNASVYGASVQGNCQWKSVI